MTKTADEALEKSRANLELLLAAFPDEIHLIDNIDDGVPPRFILSLKSNKQYWANITMQLSPSGILTVISHRGSPCSKHILEKIVTIVREAATEYGEEAAIPCCCAATNLWTEEIENATALLLQQESAEESSNQRDGDHVMMLNLEDIQWISGEPITDRKSVFQAHVIPIHSDEIVPIALEKLKSNSKIKRATHSMYAYRLTEVVPSGSADKKQNKILKHDNYDDGENAAGSKLAYLLELRKEDGVLVVVTRWYGGIPLGPKRFHHIVNCARELLEYAHRHGLLIK